MQVQELITGVRDVASVRRVYGDPYETNGLTVIPAATVRGGAGIGVADDDPGEGKGGGFGLTARPSGAWIIEDGHATWRPAIDVNRVILGGQLVALTAILVTGRVLLAHSRRRHSVFELASELRALNKLRQRVPALVTLLGR